jgi:hypothetical protein
VKELRVDERFSAALRAELISQVQNTRSTRARRRTKVWLGLGALAGAGLLGGVGAAAAGLFTLPGGEQVTALTAPVTETHTGTATVELGAAPKGATGIDIELTCLSPGHFEFADGTTSTCTTVDVGTPQAWTGTTFPLAPGQESVTIRTGPETRWQLTAKYVNQETTDWGQNARGDTYGVGNANGMPDLIAVIATNGRSGYAYRTDLEEANGTAASKTFKSPEEALAWQEARRGETFSVPVYEANGETIIGEFVING